MNKKTKQKNGKILGSASADSGASSIYISNLLTDRSTNSEEKSNK
jgi:hypothetical protein